MNTPGFPQLLLAIAEGGFAVLEAHVRMAAALLLKNFVSRHWSMPEEGESTMPSLTLNDRAAIKGQIVAVLTRVPPAVQRQLCEVITLVAAVDFPEGWSDLIPHLVSRLDPGDPDNNIAILRTLHRLFKRYRTERRTDELYTEINFVMGQLAGPLLELYRATEAMVEATRTNQSALGKVLRTQVLLNKIFYSLSAQDLPAFFEDHLSEFMGHLKTQFLFTYPTESTATSDEEPGPREKLLASVAKIANLYATRYEEDFVQLADFVQAAWQVLTSTVGREAKWDPVAAACLRLLSSVAKQERHRSLFAPVLSLLCDKVIVPNVLLRECDLELFEDEPLEYVRRFVADSSASSLAGEEETSGRAAGAISLVRGLMEFNETEVTHILQGYIADFLRCYGEAPAAKWRDKNAAVILFGAIAIKGATSALGVTRINPLVRIEEFFLQNILPDLQPANAGLHALLKVDAMRFLADFRYHLAREHLAQALPLLQHHLASPRAVVHSTAAVALDRLLGVRRQGVPVFVAGDIGSLADAMIGSLLRLTGELDGEAGGGLAHPRHHGHHHQSKSIVENEFVLRALLRVILVAQTDTMVPIMDRPLETLTSLVGRISVTPCNPTYGHSLFECVGALIRTCAPAPGAAAKIDGILVPALERILTEDVADYIHYVFQLLAILVEGRSDTVPGRVMALVPPVLQPALWTTAENIPALARFLQAIMRRNGRFWADSSTVTPLLGIVQTLVGSKVHEMHAFSLLNTFVQCLPGATVESYLSGIILVVMRRLQATRSIRLSLHLLLLICILVSTMETLRGGDSAASLLIRTFDGLQPGLFVMVLTTLLLPQGPRIRDRHDRKIVLIGLTRLLMDSPVWVNGTPEYTSGLVAIVSTLVTMLTTLPPAGLGDAEQEMGVSGGEAGAPSGLAEETMTMGVGSFWKLHSCPPPRKCPAIDALPDARAVFVNSLVGLARSLPTGRLTALLGGMESSLQTNLSNLLTQENASI